MSCRDDVARKFAQFSPSRQRQLCAVGGSLQTSYCINFLARLPIITLSILSLLSAPLQNRDDGQNRAIKKFDGQLGDSQTTKAVHCQPKSVIDKHMSDFDDLRQQYAFEFLLQFFGLFMKI
jgi:hypothetical protein